MDDVTGEPLSKRPDDTPDVFKRRLQAFYETTTPVLKYFSSLEAHPSTKMITLTGRTSDEMWPVLEEVIRGEFRLKPREAARKPSVQEAVFGSVRVDGPLYNLALNEKL